jgi:hypothetical protein
MTPDRLDEIRAGALNRMERSDRTVKFALLGALLVEGILIWSALSIIDWNDRLHRLVFILFMLSYMVMVLGMIALGAHVSRGFARLLAVLDAARRD